MATIQHSSLTDSDGLHEPKGVASATSGDVYVADGAGSGSWDPLEGTEIASTGEAGGTKFLREDGDGTCSWQAPTVAGGSITNSAETYGKILTADGASGTAFGQKVWKDLIGPVVARAQGAGWPNYTTFRTNVNGYSFGLNESVNFDFHIPHDWAVGTDIYFHVHWGHNGTNISGNTVWTYYCNYADRQATIPYSAFGSEVTGTINSNTLSGTMNITNFPQYCHVVEEIQLSAASPSASQLDTDDIAVDGLIRMQLELTTSPTITGGTSEPFLFFADMHYQADIEGTKNKDPSFYA